MHRSGTAASSCWLNGSGAYELAVPDYFDLYALAIKTITGPGLTPQTWTYSYGDRGPGRTNQLAPCSTCPSEKNVDVTQPDGSIHRHRFGILYRGNDGRLLGKEILTAQGVGLSSESYTYVSDVEAASMPFFDNFGLSWAADDSTTFKNRPIRQSVTSRQGVTFTRTVETFDAFARPLRTVRSSSLGQSRTDTVAYHDNLTRWALGQVAQSTNAQTGLVEYRTDYHATSALPIRIHAFGKLLQTIGYNADGTIATLADGRNNVTTLSSWHRGIPRSIGHPDGVAQTLVVNDSGWVTRVTDENGFATSYTHDAMGRLASVTYPGGDSTGWNTTTQVFEQVNAVSHGIPAGHWRQTITTGSARTFRFFDARWQLLLEQEYDAANVGATQRFRRFAYDHEGRTTFASYPGTTNNPTTGVRTTYDALGRPTRVAQDSELGPLVTTTEYLSGFQTRTTDPKGNRTTTGYLAWDTPTTDYPVAIAHPGGVHTDIARDVFGKPTALTRRNANGSVALTRHYVYDANQQLCKAVEPEAGATVMAYDAAGNLAWSRPGANLPSTTACNTSDVPAAQRITRSYDARNRIVGLTFPGGLGNTTYAYTPDGKLEQIATANGTLGQVSTTYTYNRRRLPVGEILTVGGQAWTLGYLYDANGQLSAHTLPSGTTVPYAPNALGQPTRAGTYATAASYFPNGALRQFTYGNGLVHTLTQNARGLPERSRDAYGTAAVHDDSMDYDGNGNVAAISDGLPGNRGDRTMSYDALDRLTATTSPMFGTASYTYDVLDNLRRVRLTGGPKVRDHTYVYDTANLLTAITATSSGGTVASLAYDVQGNLSNRNGQAYSFDHGNRLREVPGVEQYAYDGHGRRVLAVRPERGRIYSMYGQDGVLRFQRDERQGRTSEYVYLGGSQVARLETPIALATPTLTVPGYSSNGAYTVSWTTASLATRYELEEQLNGGSWSQVHSAAATSRAFTGRSAGNYGYRVRACSATACGGWSAVATSTVELPPAAAPTLSAPATGLNGSYSVSWTSVASATTYTLEQRIGTGSWTTVVNAAATSRAFSGMAAGSYGYRVKACNPAGCGPVSAIGTVQVLHPPGSAPVLSAPAANYTGGYTVSWGAVATADRYTLQERTGTGAWITLQEGSALNRAIAGKGAGSYGYQVRACNAAGCGTWSPVGTVQVTLVPTAVSVVTAPATNISGGYTVSWTSVPTATTYQLEERVNSGAWSQVHDAAATSRALTGRSAATYGYRARGCNAAGCAPWSAIASTQVVAAPTAAPSISAPAASANGNFTVSWGVVPTATRYELDERLGSGAWSKVQDAAATSRAVSDRGNGSWGYRVRGCNIAGCGAYSAIATTVVTLLPTGVPAIRTSLGIVNEGEAYTVSWTAVAGASRYELQEQYVQDGRGFYLRYSGVGTTYAFGGRGAGSYQYRVRACNASGCSVFSSTTYVEVIGGCSTGICDPLRAKENEE